MNAVVIASLVCLMACDRPTFDQRHEVVRHFTGLTWYAANGEPNDSTAKYRIITDISPDSEIGPAGVTYCIPFTIFENRIIRSHKLSWSPRISADVVVDANDCRKEEWRNQKQIQTWSPDGGR